MPFNVLVPVSLISKVISSPLRRGMGPMLECKPLGSAEHTLENWCCYERYDQEMKVSSSSSLKPHYSNVRTEKSHRRKFERRKRTNM